MSEFALLGTFRSDGEVIQCESPTMVLVIAQGYGAKNFAHVPKFTFLEEQNEDDKIIRKLHSKN